MAAVHTMKEETGSSIYKRTRKLGYSTGDRETQADDRHLLQLSLGRHSL
jgi:hypothetical protein